MLTYGDGVCDVDISKLVAFHQSHGKTATLTAVQQEQQKGIEQVNSAIGNMDSSVQKNAALVEEATAASQSLLSEANELIEVIEYFKLRN